MDIREYVKLFDELPCEEAVTWLETQKDFDSAWNNCPRGDWLWWALMHSNVDIPKKLSVDFANWCAKTAADAAAAARAYAADAAVYAARAAAAARAYAADAAADAADRAYAARAAYAAVYAAYDAAAYAADAAYAAADAAAEWQSQADWIRNNIENPFV